MSEKNFHPPPGQNTVPEPLMSGKDYPPPGQHTITNFRAKQDHVEPSMSGNDYPPPGQHAITNFRAKQDHVEPSMSGNDYPPPGQHTITNFRAKQDHVEPSMSGNDYPPPGQHTITYFRAKQDHVEPSMLQQNIPLGKQTMPWAQQYIPPVQQRTAPQMQHVQMGQVQPMPQQQYVVGAKAMPQQQQQHAQQVPGQYYQQQQQQQQYQQQQQQQQQQMPAQAMLQYYQAMPGQQYSGGAQLMQSPVGGQSPAPFLNTQLQQWTTALFDCGHDTENALITAFFPCITFGRIAEITDQGMSTCSDAGLIYGLLYFTGLFWIYSWMYRQRMRAAYSLPEDPCHDCLVHGLCGPCALCQEYRELQNRGFNMQLGWIDNMQLQAQKHAVVGVPPPVQGMVR